MLRQLLKDSALYGLAALLSRGISLLLIPFYTRALSPTDYGVFDLLAMFGTLVTLSIALEISQAVPRFYIDAETGSERQAYVSTALWFTALAFGVFSAVALFGSGPASQVLLDSTVWEGAYRVAVLAIACNGVFFLLQNQLRWQLQPLDFALASILYVAITGGLGVLLVVHFGSGVAGIFWGQIAGAVTGALFAWSRARASYALRFDWQKCREMLVFSLPLVPSSLAVFFSLYIDRLSIKHFMTIGDVGLYGIAFRFASIIGLLMVGFRGALMPLVYKHYGKDSTPRELSTIFRYFLAAALLIVAVLSLFAEDILRLFTTPQYYAAAPVIPVLAVAILLSNMYIFAPGLAIAKQTRGIAAINLAGAAMNGLLNFALVPLLGLQGAALATLISALAVFGLYMVQSQRWYPVPHQWPRIAAAAVITLVLAALGRAVLPDSGLGALMGKLALLTTAGYITVALLLGHAEMRRLARRAAAGLPFGAVRRVV